MHDLSSQKEELELKITNLQTEAERSLAQVKADSDTALYDLLCKSMILIIKKNEAKRTSIKSQIISQSLYIL